MALRKITTVRGRAVPVPGDDIDTDRIIPARFMKCVTFDGLGEYLFYDVRRDEDGHERAHNLNDGAYEGASILVAGANFGCDSSREHAPQAIYRAGYRAILANSFAEIFFGNSTQLGLVCVTLLEEDLRQVVGQVTADPSQEITIDLEAKEVRTRDSVYPCDIREGARQVLTGGRWDPLADLVAGAEYVEAVAARLPYMQAAAQQA